MTASATYKSSNTERARTEPSVSQDDINSVLDSLNTEHRNMTERKPTLLFVGDSGVGKSSCIKVILNLTEERNAETLHKMNITHDGKEGTSKPVYIEGEYLNCVDVRGKRSMEADEEYDQDINLSRLFENEEYTVDLIVGVVKADNERNFDIENMFLSLQLMCDKFNKPFIVLMNFGDNILNENRYKIRYNWLETKCQSIQKKSSWYTIRKKTLSQGVFKVSASPRTFLPTTNCVKAPINSEIDLLAPTHIIIYTCSSIRYCQQCKHAEVASPSDNEEEKEKHNKVLERLRCEPNAKITVIKASPIGLSADCPAIITAIVISEDLAGAAVLKSVAHSLQERLASSSTIISNIVDATYTQRTAQNKDQKLCSELMNLFDLPKSGLTQAQFEYTQWQHVHEEWVIRGLWRWATRDHGLEYYLTAWGIYYARKFQSLSQTIADGWAASLDAETIRQNCQTEMAQYNDDLQKSYFEYIMKNDVKEAFRKYLETNEK